MKKNKLKNKTEIKKIFTFSGHNAGIYALCTGINDECIISGSADKYVAQWNLKKGTQENFSAKLPSAVYSLLPMYHQNQLWIGTGNGQIHIIDTIKKEEIRVLKCHHLAVFDIKFAEKLNLVFSSGGDGILNVYDAENIRHINSIKISDKKLRSILINENEILVGDANGKTTVININNLEIKYNFNSHKNATNCFAVLNNKKLLSGGRDAHLNLWDLEKDFQQLKSIPAHNFAIYKILYLEEKNIIVTASRDKTIKLWTEDLSIILRADKAHFQGHTHSVNTLLWNNKLQTLISASDDRTLMSWQIH